MTQAAGPVATNLGCLSPQRTFMARSKRKTPVIGVTSSASEKADKQLSHRKHRRAVRQAVPIAPEEPLPLEKELTNTVTMSKDGKARFDPAASPELLRK